MQGMRVTWCSVFTGCWSDLDPRRMWWLQIQMKRRHRWLSHVAQPLGSLACTRVPKGQASVDRQEYDVRRLKGENLKWTVKWTQDKWIVRRPSCRALVQVLRYIYRYSRALKRRSNMKQVRKEQDNPYSYKSSQTWNIGIPMPAMHMCPWLIATYYRSHNHIVSVPKLWNTSSCWSS